MPSPKPGVDFLNGFARCRPDRPLSRFYRGSSRQESPSLTLHSASVVLDCSREKDFHSFSEGLRICCSGFATVVRPAEERPEADCGLPLSVVRRTLRVIRPPRLISFRNIKAFNPDAPSAGVDNNLEHARPVDPRGSGLSRKTALLGCILNSLTPL